MDPNTQAQYDAVQNLLQAIGESPERKGLVDTPRVDFAL